MLYAFLQFTIVFVVVIGYFEYKFQICNNRVTALRLPAI